MMHPGTYSYYTYKPLEDGDIRVVDLLSNPREPLRCQLRHVNSHDARYIALSYVWGGFLQTFPLEVDGFHRRIVLTENLYHALQDLRDCDDVQPKTFWIDQICINQHDDVEKSKQVMRMGEIYRRASQVVTYIGPEAVGDSDAINLAMLLYRKYEKASVFKCRTRDEVMEAYRSINNTKRRQAIIPIELRYPKEVMNNPAWEHLDKRIISTDWLTRLWLVQENVLNNHGVFLRGVRLIPWDCFGILGEMSWADVIPKITYCASLSWLAFVRSKVLQSRDAGVGVQVEPTDSTLKLYPLMRYFSCSFRCRKSVDKIYSILGLAEDAAELDIVPSYSAAPARGFTDLAIQYIKSQRRHGQVDWLDVLDYVGMDGPKDPTFPTWVPDFESEPYSVVNSSYMDVTITYPSVDVGTVDFESSDSLEQSILVVKGISLASLERNLALYDFSLGSPQSVATWKTLKIMVDEIIDLFDDHDYAFAVLCQTLMTDEYWPVAAKDAMKKASQALRDVYQAIQLVTSDNYGQDETRATVDLHTELDKTRDRDLAAELTDQCHTTGRNLSLTKDGSLALAPRRAQQEDVFVRLAGSPGSIYVLRAHGTMFKFIGNAFVHGLMKKEVTYGEETRDMFVTYRIV
ncbi:hypothetical protein N0V82_004933 [Gnomoniopsis sp. IMI 355080]|nr:hypothetical protein N0V82_004933 [Gnomoniopsis sp. IMI 355080]